jgi:hypothetical protein
MPVVAEVVAGDLGFDAGVLQGWFREVICHNVAPRGVLWNGIARLAGARSGLPPPSVGKRGGSVRRILCAMLLAAVSIGCIDLNAQVRYRRYYDRDARDWHKWNERERASYRRYLAEKRERYREYARLKSAQQRAYWRWRHTHPD